MAAKRFSAISAGVTLGVALLMPAPAPADILDDILADVQTCINRATQARDRAIEARDNAADARDHALEVRDNVRLGVATITGQLRDLVAEAVEDVNRIVQEELEGRDEFINGPDCAAFRQDLVTLFQRLEALLNALASVADPGAPDRVSLQQEILVIQNLPCRALFPIYRLLEATDFLDADILDQLPEITDAIVLLSAIVREDDDPPPPGAPWDALDWELNRPVTQAILNAPTAVRISINVVRRFELAAKCIGITCKVAGQKGVFNLLEVQVHGYIGTAIKNDAPAKAGIFFMGLSDLLTTVANSATNRMRHSMLIGSLAELRDHQFAIRDAQQQQIDQLAANQAAILANQNLILQNQAKIQQDLGKILALVGYQSP